MSNNTIPMISVIAATYKGSEFRPGFVESFKTQRIYKAGVSDKGTLIRYLPVGKTDQSLFEVILVGDGKWTPEKEVKEYASCLTAPREEPCCGHNTRDLGIHVARGQFIVLTNDDNYYVNGFISRLIDEINLHLGIDVFTWNCVNNTWSWEAWDCMVKRGKIDLGCVAVKREIALEVGFPWRHYDGDFDYIESCSRKVRKSNVWSGTYHVPEVWLVHN